MAKPRPIREDPAQYMLFVAPEVVRMPDGSFNVRAGKPVVKCSVAQAVKMTGVPRDTIYHLIEAGLIESERPSPRKIVVYLESLHAHQQASKQPGYWDTDRKLSYLGRK